MNGSNDVRERVFRKREAIVSRKIAGETLIVPIAGKLADMQRIFALNSLGEYIWGLLDGRSSLNDILSGVLSNFDVEKERAMADIREFVDELIGRDLIEEVR